MLLDQDPVTLRRQLDAVGLRVSQIDSGAFLMGPEGSSYGVAFLNKALRFAKYIGAPFVIAIDGLRKPDPVDEEDAFRQIQQNLILTLQTAKLYGVGINVEPHAATTASSSPAASRGPTACRACASAGSSAAPQLVSTTWGYHDYTTIGPGTLSDRLARIALQPAMRAKILARTRRILQTNLPVITGWLDAHAERFSSALPDAGAIVYVRYHDAINSTALVDRLRVEKSVLIVPGDHFGMDGYRRIGSGSETRYLRDGLDRLDHLLRTLPSGARAT